jgi:hypothetical protein
MASTFYELECGGDEPVVMERRDDGELIFHGWDQEAEEAAIELGFEPSLCWKVWQRKDHLDLGLIDVAEGDLEEVAALLAAGADVHASEDDAIFVAAEHGHLEVAKLLIDHGADVNVFYEAPLAVAATDEMHELLIEAGADPNVDHWAHRDAFDAAWDYSKKYNHVIYAILQDTSIDYWTRATNALLRAVAKGEDTAFIETLLRAGADPSAHNYAAVKNAKTLGYHHIARILEKWIEEHR